MRNHQLLEAIEIYFDAIYYCDVKLLDKVFHKKSSLFDVDKGSILVDPIASFRHDVGSRASPASKEQDRAEEIIMIDWLSSKCATVKVRLRAHNNIFVDHLCFVDGKDGWRIVSKVWHLERTIN